MSETSGIREKDDRNVGAGHFAVVFVACVDISFFRLIPIRMVIVTLPPADHAGVVLVDRALDLAE
jgi:hypothetical protein